ncbi:MAG: indole-3-glycerol phosphate synthase TrpC [Eubacteriales bacterium]
MILERIVARKRCEIERRKESLPPETLEASAAGHKRPGRFAEALRRPGEVAIIAEIKRASPSRGVIRRDFNETAIALEYESAGAAAISVLTDSEFFGGGPEHLASVRGVTSLPLLRKDFIIDEYQILESYMLGADAVLLIAAILNQNELAWLAPGAAGLGLDCLVEVHDAEELAGALASGARIIGINNRDLRTFNVDLNTTLRLKEKITDEGITVVSESGIRSREDIVKLSRCGVNAALVGEALMSRPSPGHALVELTGGRPPGKGRVGNGKS